MLPTAWITYFATRLQHPSVTAIMVEPGMQPPEGMVSNFDNPNKEMFYLCIVSNVVGVVVTTVFMGLRIWARYRLSMNLQADDSRFSDT